MSILLNRWESWAKTKNQAIVPSFRYIWHLVLTDHAKIRQVFEGTSGIDVKKVQREQHRHASTG